LHLIVLHVWLYIVRYEVSSSVSLLEMSNKCTEKGKTCIVLFFCETDGQVLDRFIQASSYN
jgi:hypothetical protein